jgi:hypothetical protein
MENLTNKSFRELVELLNYYSSYMDDCLNNTNTYVIPHATENLIAICTKIANDSMIYIKPPRE